MPVSHKYKVVFVHIHKTAGSSIDLFMTRKDKEYGSLKNYCGKIVYSDKAIYLHHANAKDMKKQFKSVWDNYFKFSFVRNPWDRVVSEYFWRKKRKGSRYEKMEFNDFIKLIEKEFEIGNFKYIYPPQCTYLIDDNNNILVDYVGRYERLKKDFAKVSKIAKIPKGVLPWEKKTSRNRDYKSYYTKETKDVISKCYEKDIDVFKYSFNENKRFDLL